MSAPIQVNFSHLSEVQSSLTAGFNNICTQMDDLRKYVDQLAQSWSGAAQETYNSKQQQWGNALNDLNNILNAVGQSVGFSNDEYQQRENAIIRSFD